MSARDPLHELEEALSFPVSPDFCARVRRQVAAQPARSRMWFGPRLALAASVVLAAGIGIVSTLRHQDAQVTQVNQPSVPSIKTPPPNPVQAVAAVGQPRAPQRPATSGARVTMPPFETVVPDDQLRALDRLLAAMRQGWATVPPPVADVEVNDRGERVLRKVVIEPVTIELLAGTPADPIKNPAKDPNK